MEKRTSRDQSTLAMRSFCELSVLSWNMVQCIADFHFNVSLSPRWLRGGDGFQTGKRDLQENESLGRLLSSILPISSGCCLLRNAVYVSTCLSHLTEAIVQCAESSCRSGLPVSEIRWRRKQRYSEQAAAQWRGYTIASLY